MLLPDTVCISGDSYTSFPIGISFPAWSRLVINAKPDPLHSCINEGIRLALKHDVRESDQWYTDSIY